MLGEVLKKMGTSDEVTDTDTDTKGEEMMVVNSRDTKCEN